MMRKISWLFILACFAHPILKAQQYNFKNYSVTDGLAQSQVYALLQDKNELL